MEGLHSLGAFGTAFRQNAAETAVVACRRFAEGKTVSAEELLPLYLRLPQAERELNARMSSK